MFKAVTTGSYVALVSFVVACTSGTGTGELEPAATANAAATKEPVEFTWESDGSSVVQGSIMAEVPGQGEFRGKYMQITSESQAQGYFGNYWNAGWADWGGWGGSGDMIVTHYSGKVIAVLKNESDTTLRCRFQLAEPSRGPEGGGFGECMGPDGETIDDVVLKGN